MAKKAVSGGQDAEKEKPPQTRTRSNSIRWVNAELNQEDVDILESDFNGALERVVGLYEGLQANQRLSVKLDDRSGRWLSILFDDSPTEGGATVALSLRAATPLDALISLAFVHLVKYADGWQDIAARTDRRFG